METPGAGSHTLSDIDLQEGLPVSLDIELKKADGTFKTMRELEREIVEKLTRECKGNISEVSRLLDVGRSTLYRWANLS